ncbi:MAG: BatD family protein [Candidatus Kapaibacteriota bacterium]
MFALDRYTQQHHAVLKSDLALRAGALSPLPLVPEFHRESAVETSYSNIVATVKNGLIDVAKKTALDVFLRPRFIGFLRFTLLLFLGLFESVFAQDVRVRALLDTASMRIGEQTRLRLSVEHAPGVQVQFPFLADSLVSKVEVIDRTAIDSTMQENKSVLERQTFTLTSFDEGAYNLPALTFTYRKPNDPTEYSIQTEPLTLAVSGVPLPQAPPTQDSSATAESENIRDIKPPLAVPRTFLEVAPYLAGAILLFGGIVWAIWYFRTHRKVTNTDTGVQQASKRPAFEVAMEELEKLREERLWQSGAVKEYHTRLADIVRVYVEDTLNVTTLEATTEEIIAELRTKSCPAGTVEILRAVLEKADMVKFAKYEALPDENERSLRLATELVQITALKEQVASD